MKTNSSMPTFYADLHLHSKYSYAVSRYADLENLSYWAAKKGIQVLGSSDFTHPAWIKELHNKLIPDEQALGLFCLKPEAQKLIQKRLPPSCSTLPRFLLSVEVSTLYRQENRSRKIHHLLYVPSFTAAKNLSKRLAQYGDLSLDGRPSLILDSKHLLEIVLEIEGSYLIPAHVWTPWFGVLGSKTGFDSLKACYGENASEVFALETGLSADPAMCRKVPHLDHYQIVSFSDAHSPQKLGREATRLHCNLDYFSIREAFKTGKGLGGTLEFYPEEGKYHWDGHRRCGVSLPPSETRKYHNLCPVCGRPLTIGVLHRVESLGKVHRRPTKLLKQDKKIVPLLEILSELLKSSVQSQKVTKKYEQLLKELGPELNILEQIPLEKIEKIEAPLAAALDKMRQGQVWTEPGYDGVYGKIGLIGSKRVKKPAT